MKGVSYSCSSPHSQYWGFPRYRELEAVFLQTVCPQCGNGVVAWTVPPAGKPPLPGGQQGSEGKALGYRNSDLSPISIWDQGVRSTQWHPSWRSHYGGIPQRPSLLPRRQWWGTGFSEHFLSVYHSSEVCDVRSLMDASIHRLDIMMYREPRDI